MKFQEMRKEHATIFDLHIFICSPSIDNFVYIQKEIAFGEQT